MEPPLPPAVTSELVRSCLRRDPIAADLRISLFAAAAQSYKRDSLLRPFPPHYLSHDHKDFEALLKDAGSLPGVRDLVRVQAGGGGDTHTALAHWILSSQNFAIRTLQKEEFGRLCSLAEDDVCMSAPAPDFLFELDYSEQLERRFQQIQDGRRILHAFHGSRLENFHSILHHGLHRHLNKTSLFGEGTYLTSDLSMALLYGPHGNGWRESLLGPVLSIIALCQIIDHPDVKCTTHTRKDGEVSERQRCRAANSEGGDVPEKYFVVTNNQLVRVKYLLVYSQHRNRNPAVRSWLVRHHFFIMMGLYLVLLILIGALNSNTLHNILQRRRP